MKVVARAALTDASFKTCSRTLAKGECKRVPQRGYLVGFFFGCPNCGFIAPFLDEDLGYHEHDGRLLRSARSGRCPGSGCRCLLRVEDGELQAVRP